MKNKKTAILKSGIALLLCISMLIGSTFAWFTDNVTVSGNIIKTGTLDIEMYWTDDLTGGQWHNVEEDGYNTIFSYDNWEPGYTDVKYIKLVNNGELAFNYKLAITPQGEVGKLAEVINVYIANDKNGIEVTNSGDLSKLSAIGLLNNVMNGGSTANGTLFAADQQSPIHDSSETIVTIAMNMITTAGNEYQGEHSGNFTITALATQAPFESDSFGADYDSGAEYGFVLLPGKVTSAVAPVDGKVPTGGVAMNGSTVSAFVPAGVAVADNADKLTLTVTPLEDTTSGITVVNDEILIPVDVHIDGIAENNDVPIIIELGQILPKYMNMGNYHLFHVEDGVNNEMTMVADKAALVAHNQYTYDPLTGAVCVAMASFSEIALLAETDNAWEGNFDYSWYTGKSSPYTIANADQLAAFGAIVGGMNGQTQDSFAGKTVKLIADINLGDAENSNNANVIFYPIGYNSSDGKYDKTGVAVTTSLYTFEGTFDGQGHTVSNIYQNTWEMKGDHNWYAPEDQYYRDGMGLFGKVYGGTVKNLTVHNFKSDGEIATTCVIAAYADGATFENIAITECNPRVYNIGNGGIVGCVGWYAKEAGLKTTFKNITVDKTNKISALWGSYDVACGGIVGQYYPTSGQTSAGSPKNAGIHFENCNMAAQMDVYNDVCGNYQYYAYRYAGMMIGSINKNLPADESGHIYPDMTGISAKNCTVNYGDWNDYYYCEFKDNGHPSYSGPTDYKFSRVPNEEIDTKNGKDKATCIGHNHTDVEDNQAIYLPFHQLFTGTGWGVTSRGLEDFDGITIQIREIEQNTSVPKFETKFTGDFLYRVGNQNTVSVGSLFKAIEKATINSSGVYVTITSPYDEKVIMGSFTAPTSDANKDGTTDWQDGEIKFDKTGIVNVTIQDYDYCKPTVLQLEVVDAVNATGATSATSNNVVLLNDCGFGSLEVSGGYTLYGNGFTMTCGSDSVAIDRTYSFVELKGGTLDNVKIVVPNFSHAIMYEKNKTENGNPSSTDNGRTRYNNIRSAVLVSANSQITNSYISGGRAAIYLTSGTLTVKNSTVYGGAVANIQAEASSNLILEDVTLIQKPIKANVNDTSKTVMGLSVVMMCDTTGKGAPVTLRGYLHQYAWANKDYKSYVPADAQDVVDAVLNQKDFVHQVTYADGVTRDSINLGFAYMPDGTTATNADNMRDERSQKEDIPYGKTKVQNVAAIYTYTNAAGTNDAVKEEPGYNATVQGTVTPEVSYTDVNDNRVFTTSYDAVEGQWKATLKVDVDAGAYNFSFDKLIVQKNGKKLEYTVKTEDGTTVDKKIEIQLNSAISNVYTLTITDDQIYDKNGNPTGEKVEHTYIFELLSTKTSLPAPQWTSTTLNGTPYIVVDSKGGDWNCAVPVLDGLKVKYWSKKQDKEIELDLANVVSAAGLSKGLQNGSNNTITITVADEYTLQITTTGFKTNDNGKPVVVNGKLYFTVSSSSNYVSTGTSERTPNISYVFTDANNSEPIALSKSFNVVYANHKGTQYKYGDFCNGTLTEATSGGGTCLAEGTLITLADGSKKAIEDLRKGDSVMAFDHLTGRVTCNDVIIVVKTQSNFYKNTFVFSDGSELVTINEHGIFDLDLNKYVNIDHLNYTDYIGHRFIRIDARGHISTKKLVAVTSEWTSGYKYDIVTDQTLNYVAEDTLSVTHVLVDVINSFDFGADAKYDIEQMQSDIAKYGLYTYDEWAEYCDVSVFEEYNIPVMKVGISKGLYTKEYIVSLINTYVLDESVQIID